MKSPFKFLDAYTKEDRSIFFGRDREIEEMYQKVFESKILLLYGISGTGKTSLIDCGLANKFEESDWLPVTVRRGVDIIESLWKELGKNAISTLRQGDSATGRKSDLATKRLSVEAKGRDAVKALQSIYLDHFKPIYLIFDQFEELFIFGDREEREEFIQIVKEVIDSEVQCRFIFSIREEYLASVTEFELTISDFLSNRMRIEKMTRAHAIEVIEGPCKVHEIEVEKGFPEALLDKLNPEGKDVELTYLQVFLDKIYKLASGAGHQATGIEEQKPKTENRKPKTNFGMTLPLLEKVGDVSDLLGSFLEEQVGELEDPDTGLVVLKAFVSVKGTKRQITEEEVVEFSKTLGKPIVKKDLKDLIQRYVNLRILRDKDENDRYELRHDSLAEKIFEKITLVERELLDVRQFIENGYENYKRRGTLLSREDVEYIRIYEDRLFLNPELLGFITRCKTELLREERLFKRITRISIAGLILILLAVAYYYLGEKRSAKARDYAVEAMLQLESSPGLSFETAYQAYLIDTNTTTAIKAMFDAFYALLNSDPYVDSTGKYIDPSKLMFDFKKCEAEILFADFTQDGEFIYGFLADNSIRLWDLKGPEIFKTECEQPVIVTKISPDNQYVAAVTSDSIVTIINRQGEVVYKGAVEYDLINPTDVINFSNSENNLVMAGKNNEIVIVDYISKSEEVLFSHHQPVTSVKFSPDDQFIASGSKDSTVIIWRYKEDSRKYDLFSKIEYHKGIVWSVDFSSNSKFVLTASTDKSGYAIFDLYGRNTYRTGYFDKTGEWQSFFSDFSSLRFTDSRFTGNELAIIAKYYPPPEKENQNELDGNFVNNIKDTIIYTGMLNDISSPRHNTAHNYYLANSRFFYDPYTHHMESKDYSPNGFYMVTKLHQSNTTRLSYKDELKIIEFPGSQPKFNDNGKYLLCIDKNELKLYVSDVNEILRLVYDEQIFGKLSYDRNFW